MTATALSAYYQRTKRASALCLALSFAPACRSGAPHDEQRKGAPHAGAHAHDEASSPTQVNPSGPVASRGLSLNAGSRWQANAETTAGVAQMRAMVDEALQSSEPEGLPGKLRDAYQTIFRQCTMTGAAHEQLHRFLVPIGPLLTRLEEQPPGQRRPLLFDLQSALAPYETYFE